MVARAEIVAEARRWIGTPYQHQASIRNVACDCIGLVAGVATALRLPSASAWEGDPRGRGYGRNPDVAMLRAMASHYLVPATAVDVGDVLLLRFDRPDPQHFGIVSQLDPLRMIHAYALARRACETALDAPWRWNRTWRSLIDSAWRYREVED